MNFTRLRVVLVKKTSYQHDAQASDTVNNFVKRCKAEIDRLVDAIYKIQRR